MTTQTPSATHDVATLTSLLEGQGQLYQQLAQLGGQQSQIIASDLGSADSADADAPEQLLRLLAQRQQLIDQIAETHEQLAPYRADWSALWQALSDQERCRIGSLVDQVEQLLAGIIKQDDQDRQKLQQAQSRAGAELKQLAAAGNAANAYKPTPSAEQVNRFTNQQG